MVQFYHDQHIPVFTQSPFIQPITHKWGCETNQLINQTADIDLALWFHLSAPVFTYSLLIFIVVVMSPKRDYWLWFSHLILCVAVTWKPPQGVLNRRDQHSHLPEIVQAFTVNPPMPYETRRRTTPQRSRGYKKRSIRPSFGNRNEIAKPLNWQQPPAPVVRLWESLQLFFFFSLLKRRPLFLSYNLQRSHVLMVLKPSPPSRVALC